MSSAPLPGAKNPDDNNLKALFAEVDKLMLPEMPPNYPPRMLYDGRVNSGKTERLLAWWRGSLREYLAAFGGGEIAAIKNLDAPEAPRRPTVPRLREKCDN